MNLYSLPATYLRSFITGNDTARHLPPPISQIAINQRFKQDYNYLHPKERLSEDKKSNLYNGDIPESSFSRHNAVTALLCALFLIFSYTPSAAQHGTEVAVKTNLLYDATTTPNIGVEIGVGNKNTLQVFYGLNPWKFHTANSYRQVKHWLVMPEFRWWNCTKFNGHFYGVHLMGGQFNAANINVPVPGVFFSGDNIRKGVRDTRYEGKYAGLGVTYGYQWILDRHWNVEAEIGVGYDHIWYDRYPCHQCGAKIDTGHSNYAGITKIGLSILYLF